MNQLWTAVYRDLIINGILLAVIGGAIRAYLSESLVVLRSSFLIRSATRKLKGMKPETMKRAALTLIKIAGQQPFGRQKWLKILTDHSFRNLLGRTKPLHKPLLFP